MFGVIMSILAGAAMSFQGVINTRLSDKIGLYESNAFVQGTAFLLGLLACFFLGKGNFSAIREVNWVYWTGGVLGLVITITVMLSIGQLSGIGSFCAVRTERPIRRQSSSIRRLTSSKAKTW